MKKLRHGLLRKLMLSYSLVFLGIVLALVILAYRYIADVSYKTAQINQSQLADKMAAQVEDYLGGMYKMAEQVRTDNRIINTFNTLQDQKDTGNFFETDILESIDVGSVLTSHNGPGMTVWRISVYNQYGDFIYSGASVEPQSRVKENLVSDVIHGQMIDLTSGSMPFKVLPPQTDRWSGVYSARYVSLLLPVTNYYGSEVYGVVEIQQPVEKLEQRLALNVLPELQVFLFDRDGGQMLPEDAAFEAVDNNRFTIVKQTVPQYGWTVALVQSKASMLRPYGSMLLFLIVGGVALALLLVLVIYIVSIRISAPLVSLSRKVHEVSIGDAPSDWVEAESTDEVKELGKAFSSMLKRLTDSIAFEKKAYLQSLQSQMNPHFLFNSLSILSGIGIEAGNEQIVTTCEKISEVMRYSADTRASTLGGEIQNLHNYLDLMKLRYEDLFSYSIDIDSNLAQLPLPRLVLQPIVENCFEHGFQSVVPPWHINISACTRDGKWVVTIADDGAGFSEEQREELDRKVKKYTEDAPDNYVDLKIGGLGLANTIIRLHFFGGATCVVTANEPRGTVVTISGKI